MNCFSSDLPGFVSLRPDQILGILTQLHHHSVEPAQRQAWIDEINILQSELALIQSGYIFLEFPIPRMGKKADCILVFGGVLFVLEFKVGSENCERHAREQVHDYALDLKNFHLGSHNVRIIPVVIPTNAKSHFALRIQWASDGVASPLSVHPSQIRALAPMVQAISDPPIDAKAWGQSTYRPTPTIIEAARTLYQRHNVQEISRSDAGAINLVKTTECVSKVIEQSRLHGQKSICFITGVPGSGKTLAGLDLAIKNAPDQENEHAVFLSGNGPLVAVLREALARDIVVREKVDKTEAQRRVKAFIQNIHHFRDEYVTDLTAPVNNVVVFDEAQRAWDKDQASKFMEKKRSHPGFNQSEPEFLIRVMDRHEDWCTVICLVGEGQEINVGEAGIQEWVHVIQTRFPHWKVYASSRLDHRHLSMTPQTQGESLPSRAEWREELHLSVSLRSFRAEELSNFVNYLIENQPTSARKLLGELLPRYPIWITRNLEEARDWLRKGRRGTERSGLVASSGAHRLRPVGLHVKAKIEAPNWFLNDPEDVRSSVALEEVATEFDVQGLELDWAGVCWDADLRRASQGWDTWAFKGTSWQMVKKEARQSYLKNTYRVLLTRARQGMVIFIPRGSDLDATRDPSYYDFTFQYLQDCGIPTHPPADRSTTNTVE